MNFIETEIGLIPADWTISTISDICEQIFSGGTPNTQISNYWDGGIPWLSSGETGNRFIYSTNRTITKEGVENSSTSLARKNDVVIASAGQGSTRGQVAICMIDTYINQSIVVIRANQKSLNQFFLFYNLQNRYNELRTISDSHSIRGSLTTKLLGGLKIACPALNEQTRIAKILYSIDDKIELNNKINQTLEKIAQAIFKSWFTDFEFPNDNGNPYKTSGGEIIDSENGEKPKGWTFGVLRDYVRFIKGKKPQKISESYIEGYLPQILIDTFNAGKILYANSENTVACNEDDILMVMDGASSGRIEIGFSGVIGSTLAKILIVNDSIDSNYLYHFLLTKQQDIKDNTTGSAIPHADKSKISAMEITIPDKVILEKFSVISRNILGKILLNKKENKTLAELRDSLLPRLMNGKIRVKTE